MKVREEQFREIVGEHQERVWNICRHYARTTDDARDLQQDVFVNVWRSLETFRGESQLSTWIYRIAVNTCLSYILKEKRRSVFNLSLDSHNISSLMQEEGVQEKIETERKLNLLHDAINRLTVIDKLLISLAIEKVSSKEMAEIIGITEPNVRTKLHRIREELRHMLKGGYNE
jgi:RNA polymerase sigma-70 factor (ECF subfamily)